MNQDFNPKFLRKYLNGFEVFKEAFNKYNSDVKAGAFPNTSETYES